jgi:hypothetical protein
MTPQLPLARSVAVTEAVTCCRGRRTADPIASLKEN